MLNSQNLINKICAKIACGGLSSLQTCQTTGALSILSTPVCSVANFSSLPCANNYTGRMIYVDSENRYYYAFGPYWINNFQSTCVNYADLVWAWGNNGYGQLGDNTTTTRSSPVSVVGSFTDWCQISAGAAGTATIAVRTNGSAWAWGNSSFGKLGDNSYINKSSPVSVVGGFTDWCQVSGGRWHTAAVRSNGSAWSWGRNVFGELGDNTATSRSSPVSVVGGFTDWCQVSGGRYHTAAVRSNGSAWSWGRNVYGELGNNTTTSRSSPVSVVGGFTDWCQISAGFAHTAAVRSNGSAWSWGYASGGQLGSGNITARSSPVSVVGGFTNWCQISAGGVSSSAVRSSGTAWSWGCNFNGQLGDNTVANKNSPVSVVGGFTDWCQISANQSHAAAVRSNGSAWSWGSNTQGQLGDNTTTNRSSPVSVVGGSFDWCQISTGLYHTAAVRQVCKGF